VLGAVVAAMALALAAPTAAAANVVGDQGAVAPPATPP